MEKADSKPNCKTFTFPWQSTGDLGGAIRGATYGICREGGLLNSQVINFAAWLAEGLDKWRLEMNTLQDVSTYNG